MKTLYLTDGGSNIFVDPENNECGRIDCQRESISRIYLVDNDMHVVYQAGEYKKEFDVVPNDIIVTFYTNDFKNKVVVVKSEDWVENLKTYNEEEQKRKEEWAKKQKEQDMCGCDAPCDSCCPA